MNVYDRSLTHSSVQFSHSVVSNFLQPHGQAARLSITNSQSLPKLVSIESVMPSKHLILCHPLLLPSVFPSIRVFSSESFPHISWPKYWSLSFNISPSSEHPGLISFRMDWLDLLAVQGTLKSLLQHHSSKGSILQHSAFFIVQLSDPHMTTGKTIALTRWIFVDKVVCLEINKGLYKKHLFKKNIYVMVRTVSLVVFFKLIYFLLKDNCFTEFCCFMSNLNMNNLPCFNQSNPNFQ